MRRNIKNVSTVSPVQVGNAVLIRTVTHYYTGKIEVVSKHELVLSSAAWIADTGRFATALATGKLNEVEPYPANAIVAINRAAIIDVSPWQHALPTTQK